MFGSRIIPAVAGIGLATFMSCASLLEMNDNRDCGAIESENHLLKTKQVLVERRNSVLEDENLSIRKEVRERDAKITLLESELQIEKKAHSDDDLLWQQKYDSLSTRFAASEKESAKKISELNELNRKTEDEFNRKIKDLSVEMQKRDSEHAHAIEDEKKESAKKEFDLSRQIENQKKDIADRDDRINHLEERIRELENAKQKAESVPTDKETGE
ncbi:MAG TPA: hypothetical protein PKK43_12000 [Spirochaetota bacterium]|nr:hypothetical protein [Spirochaetota bacterium]